MTDEQIAGLEASAQSGRAEAQYTLGFLYKTGRGVARDYGRAAETGNTDAEVLLREIGALRESVEEESRTQAAGGGKKRRYFLIGYAAAAVMVIAGVLALYLTEPEHRARFGFVNDQAWLGSSYERGINGYERDASMAAYWYRRAAENGHTEAQYNLGVMYSWGNGIPANHEQAVYWVRKAAEKGYHQAEDHLCFLYFAGKGVQQDYKQAFGWGIRAARAGMAYSQWAVACMYYYGNGVERDYKQAAHWCREAAEQGYSVAQNNLGLMYEYGLGVAQDYGQALSWYKKAIAQGYSLAQTNLNRLQEKMKPAPEEVLVLHTTNPFALLDTQTLYDRGAQYLEAKNYSEALKYFREAANRNHAPAQDKLGWMYQNGWGVPQDYAQAVEWFRKAANQGTGVKRDLQQELAAKTRRQRNLSVQEELRPDKPIASKSRNPSISLSLVK